MPWCPKCKSEYEAHVTRCVECDVDLVEDLSKVVQYVPLYLVEAKEDVAAIEEYFRYSGIEKFKVEELEDGFQFYVQDRLVADAQKYLKAYLIDQMEKKSEEKEEVSEEPEEHYQTEVFDTEHKAQDLKASVFSFLVVGGGVLLVTILNFFDVIHLEAFNKFVFTGSFGLIGLAFLWVAYSTQKKLSGLNNGDHHRKNKLDEIVNWYGQNKSIKGFYAKNDIETEGKDEGALYYIAIDVIKLDLKQQYPEIDETLLNTASEEIYNQIANES